MTLPSMSSKDSVDSSKSESNAKNIKISIIASDLSKSGAGRWQGAVRPFLLAETAVRLGHDVEILGFTDSDTEGSFPSKFPIKAIPGGHYPQFFGAARSLLQAISGDIVYAYKPKPSSFGLALLHRLRHQRPVILDIDDWELSWHGGDQGRYRWTPQNVARGLLKADGELRIPDHPVYLRWIENLVSKADAVTLHTQFLKNRFGGVYIPNGKDTDLFTPEHYDPEASRAKYGLSDYRVLMFPGAPRPYKGIEDLLAALDILNQPDLRLVIVGGSPYDDYDQILAKRWGRWLVQLPKCPYDTMPEVVAAAHVIVVPQQNRAAAQAQFPLKLTDGMAMAKPILATAVGDIPEILGDTGYLVESESPQQLADMLQTILNDLDQAAAQGQRARERCVQHYSIDAMASILGPLIQQCLKGQPRNQLGYKRNRRRMESGR